MDLTSQLAQMANLLVTYLQGSPGDSGAANKVTMHDLVHDLATMIAGNELIISDAYDRMTWTGPERRYILISDICALTMVRSSKRFSRNFQAKSDLSNLQNAVECSFIKSHSLNPSICVSWI
jgi:hypothetical protein